MRHPLVTGVDGSDGSLEAVDWAAAEAARSALPLRLVYASAWQHYEQHLPTSGTERPEERVYADNLVATAANRARKAEPGIDVSASTEPGDAVSVLLDQAHRASQLVLGTRGHGTVLGMLLGSVSLTVAARAVCPVVVVRDGGRPVHGGRVVVGLGSGAQAVTALRYALEEARVRQGELIAVRAWHAPAHEALEDPLLTASPHAALHRQAAELTARALDAVADRSEGVRVTTRLVEGPAHLALVKESADADLLVVGARRRHQWYGLQLGPTSHAALHHAHAPVAVVPDHPPG
ncbi:universal stress protein [Streptomyces physcomitrii]|uniref:UspA domain-containing protein n=1 Tax=Streptomyces albus (strain ATCC 21838 / DSM 41398 / FERM P-419 / JCM 4703 / NBRC 107858) TaxID=1081613 RepID=A0A0B5EZX6_STRA4|nr:hypothetical protein SLNWT_3261 [Streptomyces albus]AOU77945.1 hypothetical protein SLNHY_3254 [Streptomyces albus]AYN33701.1 universal stress protein [Streptomyces albus]